jgi:hypothetical protein
VNFIVLLSSFLLNLSLSFSFSGLKSVSCGPSSIWISTKITLGKKQPAPTPNMLVPLLRLSWGQLKKKNIEKTTMTTMTGGTAAAAAAAAGALLIEVAIA